MQYNAAPTVDLIVHPLFGAERRNDDRHLVLLTHVHIELEAAVGAVHDLINREGRGFVVGVVFVVVFKLGSNAV